MITGMNHITLAVTNIDRSFKFYRDVVGLKPLCLWNNGAYFLVGSSAANPELRLKRRTRDPGLMLSGLFNSSIL